MSFRARLLLAFGLAALGPLLLLGLGVRREMTRRVSEQADRRVAALSATIRSDLAREGRATRERLAALSAQLTSDNVLRLGAGAAAGDRRALLDWAGRAMRASGLAVLLVLDSAGRVLSSGHFRNEYDRIDSALARSVGPGVALLRARTPEGPVLALAAADSLRVAGRFFSLVGGRGIDSAWLATLAPAGDVAVSLVAGDSTCQGDPQPSSPRVPFIPCRPAGVVSEIGLTYVDAAGVAGEPARVGSARLVVTRDEAELRELKRGVDRWFLAAIGLTLVLAIAVAAWLAARLSKPLAELAAQTARLDLDRLDQAFATDRSDEIGTLTRLLDAMRLRLRGSAAKLREVERRAATGDLARQVNHDIKNGLVPIRNVVRHLTEIADREPASLAAIFGERRHTLESSLDYLDGLARNYARLAPTLDRSATDANSIVRELARGVRAPGVQVDTRLDESAPPVKGEAVAVRRILENLLSNAVDALEGRPGRVALASEVVGDGAARMVRLTVADTGRGMTREELDRAFSDFFSTKPSGTGLGLSVVRRLVVDLGGTLRVETAPGEGSRFVVEVPAG
jgi:signal transduction histidine kinase